MLVAGLLAITGIPSIAGGSGASQASAATTAQQIGMKVLLVTDTSSEPGFADWEATLKQEGVPYDCVITSPVPASDPPGCTSTLPSLSSTGTQVANYEGVVVADSGTSVAVKPKAPTPIIPLGGTTTPPNKNAVSKPIAYVAVQVRPKTVSISKKGKITVSLACKATKGKTAKNKLCAGSFTLTIARPQAGPPVPFQVPQDPSVHGHVVHQGAGCGHPDPPPSPAPDGGLAADLDHPDARQGTDDARDVDDQGLTPRPGPRPAHGRAPAG